MQPAAQCPASGAGVAIGIAAVAFGTGRFFDTLGNEATIAAAAAWRQGFAVLLAAERRPAAA